MKDENKKTEAAGETVETTGKDVSGEPEETVSTEVSADEQPVVQKVCSQADFDALNDRYLRTLAEYDNFRKRTQKEKEALSGDIRADVLAKFLPVYDNLERALAQNTEDEAYKKGVEMIMTQFNTTLEKLGITEIESLGQQFDPMVHNAIMHEDNEEKGENEIVQVFQKGFKYGDKVIRVAMVKVAN